MVTRKQIEAAKPEATVELARHWIWTAAQMETAADDYAGHLAKPGGQSWDGEIAEATQGRGADDRRAIINMADDITTAGNDTVNAVTESVMPALKDVRQMIENCEKIDGFTVADDLSVTYEPPAGTSEERAQQCRDACARFSQQIKDAADKWWAADQHAGELIDRLAAALPANFNPLAGGAPGQIPTGTATATSVDYKTVYPKKTAPGGVDPAGNPIGSFAAQIDHVKAGDKPATPTPTDPNAPVYGPPSPDSKPAAAAGDGKPVAPIGSFTAQIQAVTDPNKPPPKPVYDPKKVGSLGGSVDFVKGNSTPIPPPKPAFGEETAKRIQAGFNESLDGTIQGAKNLVGLGGEGAPGVAQSWADLAKGTGETIFKHGLFPIAGMVEDAQHAINDPGHFGGQKLFDVTSTVVGGVAGGEAAALRHGLLDGVDNPGGGAHHGGGGSDGLGGDHSGGAGHHGGSGGDHGPSEVGGDHGWASSRGDASLSPGHNAAANQFLENARQAEPRITQSLQDIVGNTPGSELTGLEHRLKTEDSFKEKLFGSIETYPNLSTAEHLAGMKDSVRYTMQSTEDLYVPNTQRAIDNLIADGYEPVKFKNSWDQPGYQGINSFWRDPATGQTFEVQFHTPSSFDAKMETHPLYEQERLPGTSPQRTAELQQQQQQIFGSVPRPSGSSAISLPPNGGHR